MVANEQETIWLKRAEHALTQCDLPDARVSWLAYTHNAVFQVHHHNTRYILRLSPPTERERLSSECAMLQTIAQDGLSVPQAIAMLNDADYCGLLLSYFDGVSPEPAQVTTETLNAIGRFLGRLHTLSFDPVLARPHLDWDGLFSAQGVYHPGDENLRTFTDGQVQVMAQVSERVRQAMQALDQLGDAWGIIHADLLLKNVLFDQGNLHALDFEYSGWGYYLYDLTPVLWQLKPHPRYAQFEQALWEGYTHIRPLTSAHHDWLETLLAGRQVASMRWVVANQHNPYVVGKVSQILAQRATELQDYLQTGHLSRQ
ncbi:MAG: phosphotransferase enzyme family protein [Anaerolineae bacterium]